MLSDGQIEVRKIINSFLEEYENLIDKYENLRGNHETRHRDFGYLYDKVRDKFCSNDIIKSDSVTSQPLGTSLCSPNYLQWLEKNGVKEVIENTWYAPTSDSNFPMIDFPMREILYGRGNKLEPAYKCGVKWYSTISCLFGLAQRKRLGSDSWDCIYYDAIQLWEGGNGGYHRLLSHILFGSNEINPYRLTIIRNDFVDPLLNKSLLQFDKLFEEINSNREDYIRFAFDIESLNEESTSKIKHFFCDLKADEKVDLIRCINTMRINHKYISRNSWTEEIEIDNMYCLLGDIRNARSKPPSYRKLLILKQKFLGIRTVDSIACTVLDLTEWNYDNSDDEGYLACLPGIRELLLASFK